MLKACWLNRKDNVTILYCEVWFYRTDFKFHTNTFYLHNGFHLYTPWTKPKNRAQQWGCPRAVWQSFGTELIIRSLALLGQCCFDTRSDVLNLYMWHIEHCYINGLHDFWLNDFWNLGSIKQIAYFVFVCYFSLCKLSFSWVIIWWYIIVTNFQWKINFML